MILSRSICQNVDCFYCKPDFKDAFQVIKAGLAEAGPTIRLKFIPEAMMSIMEEREDRFLT